MNWIVVRGAGDIATGTLLRLKRCGFAVAALESEAPSAIRRTVSLCEAVYEGECSVEGVTARLVTALPDKQTDWIPLFVDPEGALIRDVHPVAVVDAILAKRNLGTSMDMAAATVGLGPGFTAGGDVRAVVETMRGHTLGRVLWRGSALPNTGVPGLVGGADKERVIHAPAAGNIQVLRCIGSRVERGEVIARIGGTPVCASLTGVLRGMIRPDFPVFQGMKIADVDPRANADWHTVSDKALAVAGGVLEALMEMGVRP